MLTIKQLTELSGVSARTLRYYDEIGLLEPSGYSEAGYRLYNQQAIERLQQILFYRALNMPLGLIAEALTQSKSHVLHEQRKQLVKQQERLAELIAIIDDTLGDNRMTNAQKFEVFKQQKVTEQEALYGKESREKYGQQIEASREKFMKLTEDQYEEMTQVEQQLFQLLSQQTADDKQIVALHKKWLSFSWSTYTIAMHEGLVMGYLADERFITYYDSKAGVGATQKLYEAVMQQT